MLAIKRVLACTTVVACAAVFSAAPSARATVDTSSSTSSSAAPTTALAPAPLVEQVPSNSAQRPGPMLQVGTTQPPPTTAPPPPDPWLVPANSGNGRRVIFSRSKFIVWIIDGNNNLIRSYRVTARRDIPPNGTYRVFSRSSYTCNIDITYVCMRYMVRFTKGPNGDNIGFHEIPRDKGVPVMSESALGTGRSGGCVRQSTADAQFMWSFGTIGTVVVVVS